MCVNVQMSDETQALIFKSRAEQAVEARYGEPVAAILRRLYHDDGLSQEEIADRLGTSRSSVIRWMATYRIPTRDRRKVAAA